MVFEKTSEERQYAPNGDVQWLVSGETVATGATRTQPGKFTLAGDGLCIGWDSADAVSADYHASKFVAVDVTGQPVVDLERDIPKHCSLATRRLPDRIWVCTPLCTPRRLSVFVTPPSMPSELRQFSGASKNRTCDLILIRDAL